jgi:hypothetical protein
MTIFEFFGKHPETAPFPDSTLLSKFNPWNIKHMPAFKFIERLKS